MQPPQPLISPWELTAAPFEELARGASPAQASPDAASPDAHSSIVTRQSFLAPRDPAASLAPASHRREVSGVSDSSTPR